ncbi:hypothetical protein [Enhygromyxa salina]|uniref:hypothetical protein n=1 Tax=Enhygromyxa salina TaxID=215803 RepID=UPI0011BA8994|nr:hypothetical protein [Enhygromyxa salina]
MRAPTLLCAPTLLFALPLVIGCNERVAGDEQVDTSQTETSTSETSTSESGDPDPGDTEEETGDGDGDGEPPGDLIPDGEALNPDCEVSPGDHSGVCEGPQCPILEDIELRCPHLDFVNRIELGLTPSRLYVDYRQSWDEGSDSFILANGEVDFVAPLPGPGFSGQRNDGTLYRAGEGETYHRQVEGGWLQIPLLGNPVEFDPDDAEAVWPRPSLDDELHLMFAEALSSQRGGTKFHWLAPHDGGWVVEEVTVGDVARWPLVVDFDPLGRRHVWMEIYDEPEDLSFRVFGEPETQLPAFSGDAYAGRNQVPTPPRPALGAEGPPLAMLRAHQQNLVLLTGHDPGDLIETPIAGARHLEDRCDSDYSSFQAPCEPCEYDDAGVEFSNYELVRGSHGELWGVWLWISVDASMSSQQVDNTCVGSVDSIEATGELRIVELGADASVGRQLAIPLDGLVAFEIGSSSNRTFSATAYDDVIAVALEVAVDTDYAYPFNDDTNLMTRVMVIDTTLIE